MAHLSNRLVSFSILNPWLAACFQEIRKDFSFWFCHTSPGMSFRSKCSISHGLIRCLSTGRMNRRVRLCSESSMLGSLSLNPLPPDDIAGLIYERKMSPGVREPTFCISENKDADQLRGNHEADQRLCFRYLASTIPLPPESKNFKPLTISSSCTAWFVSDLVRIHIVDFLKPGLKYYCKVPKFSYTKIVRCKLPKIQTKRPNLSLLCQNGAKGIANNEDPDQTAPRNSLIWVCTVCPDLSVRKLRVIMVYHKIKSKTMLILCLQLFIHVISLKRESGRCFFVCLIFFVFSFYESFFKNDKNIYREIVN